MCDEKTFDDLVELYKTDPDAFEEYRRSLIEKRITEMCADCPERLERCRQFQWRIEQQLSKYKDPMARYNAMVGLFWKQFDEFQKAVKFELTVAEAKQNADILQFPKKG